MEKKKVDTQGITGEGVGLINPRFRGSLEKERVHTEKWDTIRWDTFKWVTHDKRISRERSDAVWQGHALEIYPAFSWTDLHDTSSNVETRTLILFSRFTRNIHGYPNFSNFLTRLRD